MADEIIALHARLSQQYDLGINDDIVARLESLPATEGTLLYDRCLTADADADPDEGSRLNLLGWCHYLGLGTPKDDRVATDHFRRSAELGNISGMHNFGVHLEDGLGTSKDSATAVEWFTRSALLGNPISMNLLGRSLLGGIGIPKDEVRAVEWFTKSASLGWSGGMNLLGYCLRRGIGIPKDDAKSTEWYARSASLGNFVSMNNLAYCLEFGIGVAKDLHKAYEWYTRSATLGYATGMANLGLCFQDGIGVPQDQERAVEWFTKSFDLGNYRAGVFLGRHFLETRDRPTAFKYFVLAQQALEAYQANNVDDEETEPYKHEIRQKLRYASYFTEVPFELLRRWVAHEDENGDLTTRNQALSDELEVLRARVLDPTESEREPAPVPAPATVPDQEPAPEPITRIMDLQSRLSRRYDPFVDAELLQRLRALDGVQAQLLYDTCHDIDPPSGDSLALLGWCHQSGNGVPKDDAKALDLYIRSAEMGNPSAMNSVADIHRRGGNPDGAIMWSIRSADLGNGTAMWDLAVGLETGVGVPKDEAKASEWISRSAHLGNPDALSRMGDRHATRDPADLPTAGKYWFRSLKRNRTLDPEQIDKIKDKIRNQLRIDDLVKIVQLSTLEEKETATLKANLQTLLTEVDTLRTDLRYRPDGSGYREALHDFGTKASLCRPHPPGPVPKHED